MVVIVTQKQQMQLKKMLMEQKEELLQDQPDNGHDSLRDAVDELSTIDNHPADLGTELFEREKDMALKVHMDDRLSQIEAALQKIEDETYGICEKCQEPIPYDRLCAIPFTTFCIEHTEAKIVPTDRPVEEEIILPPVDNSFAGRDDKDALQDDEDSFQIVARYGNSDTPSDFESDYDNYNDLYDEENMYAALDELHVSPHESLGGQISREYMEEARKTDYLD